MTGEVDGGVSELLWYDCGDASDENLVENRCIKLLSWRCDCLTLLYSCTLIFPEDQLPSGFPTIDMGPQLKVVERSRTATMLCAASGNPDPEITWFKDFLPVNTSNNNGRIKQLRSGNQRFYPSILSLPFNPSFYIHLRVFLPSTLLLSRFQIPLPLILYPILLLSVPTKLL